MGFIMYKLSIKIAYWFVVAFVLSNLDKIGPIGPILDNN